MKKQYLFCYALLLSTYYAQPTYAMQEQYNALNNEQVHQEEAQLENCYICKENIENPRRLTCNHEFCDICISQWALEFQGADGIQCPNCRNHADLGPSREEAQLFNQVMGSLEQPAQPVPAPNIQVNHAPANQLPQEQIRQVRRFLNQVKDRRFVIAGSALVATGALVYKLRKPLIKLYARAKAKAHIAYRKLLAFGKVKNHDALAK